MNEPAISPIRSDGEPSIRKLKRIIAVLASIGVVGMVAYLSRPFIGGGQSVDRRAIGGYSLWLIVWALIFIPALVKKWKPALAEKNKLLITIVCLIMAEILIGLIIWSIW